MFNLPSTVDPVLRRPRTDTIAARDCGVIVDQRRAPGWGGARNRKTRPAGHAGSLNYRSKKMNNNVRPTETEMSLAITGRYVDEQVAKGRALDDVLAEGGPGQAFWRDKKNLRDFSEAVRKAQTN